MAKHNFFPSKVSVMILLAFIAVACSCKFDVEMIQITDGDGFHRNVTYQIVVRSLPVYQSCLFSLEQPIPAGLYVNPDELFELTQAQKIVPLIYDRVDVELPAEKAPWSAVYLMKTLDTPSLEWFELWVPMHARYANARQGGGHARINIPHPKLFVKCEPASVFAESCKRPPYAAQSGHCAWNGSCEWMPIHIKFMGDELAWEVPVGDLNYWPVVASVTLLIIFGCSVFLAFIARLGSVVAANPFKS